MKSLFYTLVVLILCVSCNTKNETDKYPVKSTDWSKKTMDIVKLDSLNQGQTYLPIYSHIYHLYDQRTFDLTATVSIRNISPSDTLYLLKADYYNTLGKKIRSYANNPVYLKPLETLEIIIEEKDVDGGSGAKFLFDWAKKNAMNKPLFEAVMVSSYGQQGLSIITKGINIDN